VILSQDRWAQTFERLAARLSTLTGYDTLVLREVVDTPPDQRRSLFRRARPAPFRYVQFRLASGLITGECVGASSWGGSYDIDEQTDRRLRELGWAAPDERPQALRDSPNYRVDVPPAESPRLARMAVDALDVLGVAPDAELAWDEP